jgi:hypothetical protein
MAWRDSLIKHFGPGLLGGITLGDWVKALRDNHFAVAPACLPRVLAITGHASQNSLFHWCENWRYGSSLKDVAVSPPVFLLGHWRNGTTHLHNLITVDQRFAFPNTYQSLFPNAFLTTEAVNSRVIDFFMPKRRPMDNVEWSMRSPQEDEFALCISSLKSPCMSWVFPQRREQYDKYLTFRDVSDTEIAQWQAAFVLFLKKLTWKYRRPLVLKSPPHTCRIRLLLQMFPEAKFVHIHRDPFAVFQSTRKMLQVNLEMHRIQKSRLADLDERILQQYRTMYDAFFDERSLIPEGRFHEIGFETLEQDPVGQVRRIYEALNLPDFEPAEPALRRYVDSIAGYQKNEFPTLPPDLRTRIAKAWRPCFDEWSYPV